MVLPCMKDYSMYNRDYILPLEPSTTSIYAYHANYFSSAECDTIIQLGSKIGYKEGTVGDNGLELSIRKSRVAFFKPSEIETRWIFDRLLSCVKTINRQFWNFDLRFLETLQFSMYSDSNDFYTKHMDMKYSELEVRKLSISVQLSDPTSYTGGDLSLFGVGDNMVTCPRDRGTVIAFPSYHVHEVTPVTKGQRYSLVSWIIGPPFK